MEMTITFPGGKRVDASFGNFTVHTDQSPMAGGEGSAPEPFAHFLASIGTCAGIYVVGFCQARGIPSKDIRIVQRMEFDAQSHRLAKVQLDIQVPPDFPSQYIDAVGRAAAACAVKKAIANPPEFAIAARVVEEAKQGASAR